MTSEDINFIINSAVLVISVLATFLSANLHMKNSTKIKAMLAFGMLFLGICFIAYRSVAANKHIYQMVEATFNQGSPFLKPSS